REPRPAGAVIENWNGFDESGSFYVPDLPHFVVAIAATALPENAILTSGNRAVTYLQKTAVRSGSPLLSARSGNHEHHQGLTALEDSAPALKVKPINATWSSLDRIWLARDEKIGVSYSLSGPSKEAFEREPSVLMVFVGDRKVLSLASPHSGQSVQIPLKGLPSGVHIVAFDWVSDYGPVAVDAFRIVAGKSGSAQAAIRK